MCELLDRYIKQGEEIGRAEGREEGREEGRAEGAVSGAITMLRKLNYSEEKIIEELVSTFNMSQDDARKRVKAG